MPAQPKIDPAEMAANYGFALSVLNSDPSLKKLFNTAVQQSYSPARFVAELRNTSWFRKNSDSFRAATVLQQSDPATWTKRQQETQAQIADMAGQMGASLPAATLSAISTNALRFGWNENQIKNLLAGTVKMQGGHYQGQAEQLNEQLNSFAAANGVKIGDNQAAVRNILAGNTTIDTYQGWIRQQAAGAFPAFADQIKSGMNVSDIAEPYRQQMAQTLEIDPASIDLFDPTLRKGLQSQDPKTGQVGAVPLWQFEQGLKKDSRWLSTKNAQDSLMGAAHGVLQSFGMVS